MHEASIHAQMRRLDGGLPLAHTFRWCTLHSYCRQNRRPFTSGSPSHEVRKAPHGDYTLMIKSPRDKYTSTSCTVTPSTALVFMRPWYAIDEAITAEV